MTFVTPEGFSEEAGSPSPWVEHFSRLIREGGNVLDVAAGRGRHSRLFLERGFSVVAVDRDVSHLQAVVSSRFLCVQEDLELGKPWPFADGQFDAVVVVNYLCRKNIDEMLALVSRDGVLLYETFAEGNELYGRPQRPEFLLKRGELYERVAGRMRVVAFEEGYCPGVQPSVRQRICAVGVSRKLEDSSLVPRR